MHKPRSSSGVASDAIVLVLLIALAASYSFGCSRPADRPPTSAEPAAADDEVTHPGEVRASAIDANACSAPQPARSGTTERQSAVPIQVTNLRFETENQIRYARGTATNISGKQLKYMEVELSLLDKGGIAIGSVMANTARETTVFKPGAAWQFRVVVLDTRATSLKVRRVSAL